MDPIDETPTEPETPAYHRVLIKLSGEVFGGGKVGVDPDVVHDIASQIATVVRSGVQVASVLGGGNFFRGAELQQRGMDRARADYMGMLGIVMNCLALQDFLEKEGIETRVQTAITMGQVAEPYIPRRAIRHLEKGRVVIFGAGAGMPYFSTDTVAAQRALETKCEVVLMGKNGVDGVYNADPRTHPDAMKYDEITFVEALQQGLKVADATAFALCMENHLPMIVFGMQPEGSILRVVQGEKIGTLVSTGDAGTTPGHRD
jgi:uridylate kinase